MYLGADAAGEASLSHTGSAVGPASSHIQRKWYKPSKSCVPWGHWFRWRAKRVNSNPLSSSGLFKGTFSVSAANCRSFALTAKRVCPTAAREAGNRASADAKQTRRNIGRSARSLNERSRLASLASLGDALGSFDHDDEHPPAVPTHRPNRRASRRCGHREPAELGLYWRGSGSRLAGRLVPLGILCVIEPVSGPKLSNEAS